MDTEFLFEHAANLCKVRWSIILLTALLAVISVYLGAPLSLFRVYVAILAIATLFNIISSLKYSHYQQNKADYTPTHRTLLKWWTYFQTLSDLLLLTAGIHYTGGIHSPAIYLLIIYISGMAMSYGEFLPVLIFTILSILLFTFLFEAYKMHWLAPVYIFSKSGAVPPPASFIIIIASVDSLLLAMAGITLLQSKRLHTLWKRSETEWAFFSALHNLSHHGLQYHDLHQTVHVLSQQLQTLLEADDAFTILWEERNGHFFPLATHNLHTNLTQHPLSATEQRKFSENCNDIFQQLHNLQPLWLPVDDRKNPLPSPIRNRFGGYRALLLLPIHAPGDQTLIGAMTLAFREAPPDTEGTLQRASRALEVVAPMFSRAITLHKTSSHLALLQELANDVTGLTQNLNLQRLVPTITESAARLLGASAALLVPSQTAPTSQYLTSWHAVDVDRDFAQTCYAHIEECEDLFRNEPFLQLSLPNDCNLLPPSLQKACAEHGYRLLACFRVPSPRAPLGLLLLFWQKPRHPLTPHEIAVGKLFAARAGAALYNAYLYHLLRREARTDALTGLPNRRAVEEALEREWKRAQRYRHPFSIAMVDLNHFKKINDRFGHQKGDLTLQRAASILKRSLRETDFVGRYGGDEFLIIFPETDKPTTYLVLEKLAKAVSNASWNFLPPDCPVSIAYGVATYPDDAAERYTLINTADKRLYENKTAE